MPKKIKGLVRANVIGLGKAGIMMPGQKKGSVAPKGLPVCTNKRKELRPNSSWTFPFTIFQ